MEEFFNNVYDILVNICGAQEFDREFFIYRYTSYNNTPCTEWRFCGVLGLGGKFWYAYDRLYVTCYREDETPKRLEIIAKANQELKALCDKEFLR